MSHKLYTAALYEGTFSVGLDKKFVRIERTDPPRKGALKLSINPFLLKDGDRNILIEAGAGFVGPEGHSRLMKDNLAEHGLKPEDITDVVCSHLHTDHIGGLAQTENGEWHLSFPNATVYVHGEDWEKTVAADNGEDSRSQFIQFINREATLKFVQDGDQPFPGLGIQVIGGHTVYSLLITYVSGSGKFLMAGDVLASKGDINRKYAAKYDHDGKKSMEERERLTKKAYEEGYTILAYHSTAAPMFRLVDYDQSKGYTVEKL